MKRKIYLLELKKLHDKGYDVDEFIDVKKSMRPDSLLNILGSNPKPAKIKVNLSEFEEQCLFVEWFKAGFKGCQIASLRNHGTRTQKEKVDQITEGMLKGISDLVIPTLGLWIEFKKADGGSGLSDEQRRFGDHINKYTDQTFFEAHGFEQAKVKLVQYLRSSSQYRGWVDYTIDCNEFIKKNRNVSFVLKTTKRVKL